MNIEVQEVLLHFETRHFSGIMPASELDSGGRVVQLLTDAGDCCLRVRTSSESQIASYSMGIKGFFLGVNNLGLKLTRHPQLVPKLRISEATSPVPHMPLWLAQGQLYLLLLHIITVVCGSNPY
jgi:hypothetical protein